MMMVMIDRVNSISRNDHIDDVDDNVNSVKGNRR